MPSPSKEKETFCMLWEKPGGWGVSVWLGMDLWRGRSAGDWDEMSEREGEVCVRVKEEREVGTLSFPLERA